MREIYVLIEITDTWTGKAFNLVRAFTDKRIAESEAEKLNKYIESANEPEDTYIFVATCKLEG